ncbi:hypothetical protein M3Y96_01008800 [Aphelenchoides besseyi]|nr:hypothetical protein M3Y96_01008800 [Aphelenchoides besseyi]
MNQNTAEKDKLQMPNFVGFLYKMHETIEWPSIKEFTTMVLSLRFLFFMAAFVMDAFASAHWPGLSSKNIGWDQSTAVTGTILCNGRPESGIRVRLFDHDKLDPDDKMGEAVADSTGVYHVSGKTVNSTVERGLVPSDYVTKGASPKKTFNAGVTELASVKPNC